jgi:NDP-sugar pyrophosphorylase family protein
MGHRDSYMPDTAAILAGGLGTRLRSVVADVPKALASVQNRPFITILLDQLAAAGIQRVVLLTGYGASEIGRALGDRYAGMTLSYSVEPSPRGTGGAVRYALDELQTETFLLLNGDSFCEVSLPALAQAHRRENADLTLTLTQVSDTGRFGRVRLAPDSRVVGFEEKAGGGPGWINAGVYFVSRALIHEVTPHCICSLERDLLPGWASSGRVYGFRASGTFLDIGTPTAYASAAHFSFNPEPAATADVTSGPMSAVAAGSGLNDVVPTHEASHAPA